MQAGGRTRYTTVAMLLHWLIAGAIVFQILIGLRMGWGPKGGAQGYALFQLHKSVGITILLLSLARLGWRLVNPPPHIDQPAWEALAAKAVHLAFYGIMIGLPLTGWIMVSVSKTNIPTLLYGTIPWPHLPILPHLADPQKHAWREAAELGHGAMVYLTYALLALHLGAVAKHQIIDRDAVFSHMAAGAKPGLAEPRLWLAAAAFIGVLAFGLTFAPGIKPAAAPATPPAAAEPAPSDAPSASAAALAASAAASSAPLSASASAPTAASPAPAEAPVAWTLRKSSTLGFQAAWSGQPIDGRFDKWSGEIVFSPTALDQSHVTVTVDLSSASTGDAQRDATLPTEDWFNVAAYPKAVFTATRFRKTGEGRFVADGTLDLHGVKKPVSLPFSLKIDGKTAHANGSVTIDRTVFGVGHGEMASTDSVPAAVKVNVQVVADRP